MALDSYRELLDLLVATPTKLKDAATAAGDPPSGEWSAAQTLAHMAAAERLWLGRLNGIINQPDALLKQPGDEYKEYQDRLMAGSVDDNLAEFNTARGEVVSLLMGLSLRDWEKTGTHERRGEITIADVVEDMVDHDAEHLGQIEALG